MLITPHIWYHNYSVEIYNMLEGVVLVVFRKKGLLKKPIFTSSQSLFCWTFSTVIFRI